MSDFDEKVRVMAGDTKEHLMKKLSKILHEAEDEGRALTASELDDVMDIWKTMRYVCDYLNSPAR